MQRKTPAETERQKKLQNFCNYKKPAIHPADNKRICKVLLSGDEEKLKKELYNLYLILDTNNISDATYNNVKIIEWIVFTYLNLRAKYSDLKEAIMFLSWYLQKEIERAEDFQYYREADYMGELNLIFLHEIGDLRNKEKELKKKEKEFVSEKEIAELRNDLNFF